MGYTGTYRDVGLTKMDIIVILKSIANKSILFDQGLVTKNYQSIFKVQEDLIQFLNSYNAKSYFNDYCNERISEFERKLRYRLLSASELEKDEQVSFPRKEMTSKDRLKPKENRPNSIKTKEAEEETELLGLPGRESPIPEYMDKVTLTKMVSAPPRLIEQRSRETPNFKDPRFSRHGQRPPYFKDPQSISRWDASPKKDLPQIPEVLKTEVSKSSKSSRRSSSPSEKKSRHRHQSPEKKVSSNSRSNRNRTKESKSSSSSADSSSSKQSNPC